MRRWLGGGATSWEVDYVINQGLAVVSDDRAAKLSSLAGFPANKYLEKESPHQSRRGTPCSNLIRLMTLRAERISEHLQQVRHINDAIALGVFRRIVSSATSSSGRFLPGEFLMEEYMERRSPRRLYLRGAPAPEPRAPWRKNAPRSLLLPGAQKSVEPN